MEAVAAARSKRYPPLLQPISKWSGRDGSVKAEVGQPGGSWVGSWYWRASGFTCCRNLALSLRFFFSITSVKLGLFQGGIIDDFVSVFDASFSLSVGTEFVSVDVEDIHRLHIVALRDKILCLAELRVKNGLISAIACGEKTAWIMREMKTAWLQQVRTIVRGKEEADELGSRFPRA